MSSSDEGKIDSTLYIGSAEMIKPIDVQV